MDQDTQLRDCAKALIDLEEGLTPFELGFVESIYKYLDHHPDIPADQLLSPRQQEILLKIYDDRV
jgi:hypothetical protein